jgi:methylated-DNA-[protein]-cysteine S-methyltransferase
MSPRDPDPELLEHRLAEARDAGLPSGWERMTAALAARAAGEKLLDVAVARHDSALGPLLLAATAQGVVRLGLPIEDEAVVLEELARRISGRVLRASRPSLETARRQLDEYFALSRTRFEVPLDWRLTRGFRREVLAVTSAIPYGRTVTYSEVAGRAGSPHAARAAGTALATNPLPILVPCHRVLRRSGTIGPYRGGTEAKGRLLALEAEGEARAQGA